MNCSHGCPSPALHRHGARAEPGWGHGVVPSWEQVLPVCLSVCAALNGGTHSSVKTPRDKQGEGRVILCNIKNSVVEH